MLLYLKAAILGVVEGVTEFLPVSSTGHLIIVNRFLEFQGAFAEMFDIVIQMGAIFAVVVHFRDRLMPVAALKDVKVRDGMLDIWFKSAVGVLPALVIGASFGSWIQRELFNPFVVAGALIVGGIILIAVEMRRREGGISGVGGVPYWMAFAIGLIQCLGMIPGTSRSAATIIGAMLLGASRPAAAEFSFYLAIPTLGAASAYSLMKHGAKMSGEECVALGIGFIVSFFVAWAVIALFMRYIRSRDFKPFGYYRIALGVFVLAYFLFA